MMTSSESNDSWRKEKLRPRRCHRRSPLFHNSISHIVVVLVSAFPRFVFSLNRSFVLPKSFNWDFIFIFFCVKMGLKLERLARFGLRLRFGLFLGKQQKVE